MKSRSSFSFAGLSVQIMLVQAYDVALVLDMIPVDHSYARCNIRHQKEDLKAQRLSQLTKIRVLPDALRRSP